MKKLVTLLLVVINFALYAQQDLTLYYMKNVPQRMYLNPAFKPASKINIGLPAISSIYLDHMNTVFTPKNILDINGGQTTINTDKFANKLKKNNYIGLNAKIDLFSFGFQVKKNYFSFNVTENLFFRANFSKGFLEFPIYGNAGFSQHDGELDFSNTGVNASHYREFGLGWQREINDKLSLGLKLKLLSGKANLWTRKNTFTLQTDPTTYDWTVNGEFDVRSSGFDTASTNSFDVNDYFFNSQNKGVAIDLGGTYKLTEKIELNASVVDFGFIRWASNNLNVRSNDATFSFRGLDLTNVIYAPDSVSSDSVNAAVDRLITSAKNELGFQQNNAKYTKMLLTRIHLGGTYKLYEGKKSSGTASILLQSEVYQSRLRPSLTLSYNQALGRWLNASVSYSMVNRGYNNLGLGLSLNLGPVQFYATVDNVLPVFQTVNFNSTDNQGNTTTTPYPYNAHKVHAHVGLNLTFGRERKDTDKDGIVDKHDLCPDVFGLKEFNGCPDTDADGIQDSEDDCPNTPGSINGCPDTDKDGIIDKHDKCPEVYGLTKFEGCPDTDEDGIQDSEDKCPKVKGLDKFNGCPDTDEDGIQDSEDKCPEVAGPVKHKGCPDTDKDGIIDIEDKCPKIAGPLENKGCPWGDRDNDGIKDNLDKCPDVPGAKDNNGCPYGDIDGDGVLDKDDACPDVPGVVANKGCPEIKKEEVEILKKAFDNLEFESGKDIIKSSSFSSLNQLAGLLAKKKEWNLKISGHTDNVGKDATNMALSKKRSLAVKKYLTERGVSSDRLITLWYGETQPISSNKTKEGRQKNRRVEMEIVF